MLCPSSIGVDNSEAGSEVCFSQARGEEEGRWEVGSGSGLKDEDDMR